MAKARLNLLRNPDFSAGKVQPSAWKWTVRSGAPTWEFAAGRDPASDRTMRIRADDAGASGALVQTVRVKGCRHYRVEATLAADCVRTDPIGGVALDLVVLDGDEVVATSPGCGCAARQRAWNVWRRYYRTPAAATHLQVRVALRGAVGDAKVESVRVVPIEAPEALSHPLAVPPPPVGCRPPNRVRSVCICDDSAAAAQLARIIGLRLGSDAVTLEPSGAPDDKDARADAVILPASAPVPAGLTLKRLHKLAADTVVIIGLEAFANLVNAKHADLALKTRVLKQTVQPPHARIAFADFLTHGFALGDIFPYWWDHKLAGVYAQRHLRNTPAFRKFCKKKGYETILTNEGATDAMSGHPLCLYRGGERGGVVVIDTEPVVAHPTSEDESCLAVHLLLNMLGAPQHALGQFVVPPGKLKDLTTELDEFGTRFPAIQVHPMSDGEQATESRWVEVNATGDGHFGLPVVASPAILIRTGGAAWDWDGVYGTLLWIKSLLRPAPYSSRCVQTLLGSRRIAWTPLMRPDRWGRLDAGHAEPDGTVADFDPGSVAAVIDIASTSVTQTRVVVPEPGGPYAKYEQALAALAAALLDGRHLYYAAGDGVAHAELNGCGFLPEPAGCAVVADAASFATDLHRAAQQAGAECLRLELPAEPHAGCAHSIRRTDRVALLLEWLVGLQIGLLAVNRDAEPVTLDVPLSTPQGGRLSVIGLDGNVDRADAIAPADSAKLHLMLEPGATAIVERN